MVNDSEATAKSVTMVPRRMLALLAAAWGSTAQAPDHEGGGTFKLEECGLLPAAPRAWSTALITRHGVFDGSTTDHNSISSSEFHPSPSCARFAHHSCAGPPVSHRYVRLEQPAGAASEAECPYLSQNVPGTMGLPSPWADLVCIWPP